MRTCSLLGLSACLLALCSTLSGADWPQWRGPERTGISKETGLLKAWPKDGPKLLWTFDKAGNGYSSFAVVGGTLYTMGTRGADDYALAIDAKGTEKWATKIGKSLVNNWSRGPVSTPTVDGDLVFAVGSTGTLICANKDTGAIVWSKDLRKEMAAEVSPEGGDPEDTVAWGFAWAPLVDGDNLIIVPGGPKGLFAALDKKKGDLLWRSKDAPTAKEWSNMATYGSPVATTVAGVRQYVYVTQTGIVGVSAKDGDLLWRHVHEKYPDVVCATPICKDDLVYVSVGYGAGGTTLLKLTPDGKKFKATPVYEDGKLGNRQGGVVLIDKHVYGYNDNRGLMCQDFATGEKTWETFRGPKALKGAAVIAAEGRLYAMDEGTNKDEKTNVVLVAAEPKAYEEISRFQLPQRSKSRQPSGRVWAHPAISDGKLYLRDQELIFCYEIK